jgi:hypothetical protein
MSSKEESVINKQMKSSVGSNKSQNEDKNHRISPKITSKPIEPKIEVINERKEIILKKKELSEERHNSDNSMNSLKTTSKCLSTETMSSSKTIESQKYAKILDKYIVENFWNLGIEYIVSCVSTILWSLLVIYFLFYETIHKCSDQRFAIYWTSVSICVICVIHTIGFCLIWTTGLSDYAFKRSKLCFAVITIEIIMGSTNLLLALICFGSKTCDRMERLDKSVEDQVLVKYLVKTLGILHTLIAMTLFIRAMLLAVKRSDFKHYVLWRKGVLNQYLRHIYEDD